MLDVAFTGDEKQVDAAGAKALWPYEEAPDPYAQCAQTPPRAAAAADAIIFDIETGGLPEDKLRKLYKEPTFEEFSEKCDQRWKPETKEAKFKEAKADGWKKFVERAALSPITGEVLAIGIRTPKGDTILTGGGEGEAAILRTFWNEYVDKADGGSFIGWNIQNFDLPFLVRRSWYLDVDVPECVIKGRYFSSMFVDLMVLWACGGRDMMSLDNAARFFGVGQKPEGVDGGMFAGLYRAPDTRQKALDYLINDLSMTAKVARKMGVC